MTNVDAPLDFEFETLDYSLVATKKRFAFFIYHFSISNFFHNLRLSASHFILAFVIVDLFFMCSCRFFIGGYR